MDEVERVRNGCIFRVFQPDNPCFRTCLDCDSAPAPYLSHAGLSLPRLCEIHPRSVLSFSENHCQTHQLASTPCTSRDATRPGEDAWRGSHVECIATLNEDRFNFASGNLV